MPFINQLKDRLPKSFIGDLVADIRHILHTHRLPTTQPGHGVHYLLKWLVLGALIGIVAGLGALAFQYAIQWVTGATLGQIAGFQPPQPAGEGQPVMAGPAHRWLIPVITAVGGLICGLIIFKLAPEAEGHGTDAAIEAYHQKNGFIRWRIPYVKLVASSIIIGTGGSAGREGPTAQIGAGFGSFLGQVLKLSPEDRRIALAAGLGAGIGAIFKAPLGGGILAAEILYLQGLEIEVLVPAFISTMVAYSIYASVVGFTPMFGTGLDVGFADPWSLVFFAVLGIVCGLMGIAYARTFYGMRGVFHRWSVPNWIKPAVGGLIVGLAGMELPQILGMGYGWVQIAMSPTGLQLGLGIMAVLVFAKILATSLSVGSGGSGGVFAPGVVIGGLTGATLWQVLHGMSSHLPSTPVSFVVVGMMAFFGAVGHAPLAVMVMIAEMTGSYSLLPPAMVAVGLASVVVGRNTIYASQVTSPAESPVHRHEYASPLLHKLKVGEAMKIDVVTVNPDTTVAEAGRIMRERHIKGLPVLETGKLVGIVANIDVVQVPRDLWQTARVKEIMATSLAVAHTEDALDYALELMQQRNVSRLPVVDTGNASRLIGIVTTSDVVDAYRRAQNGEA